MLFSSLFARILFTLVLGFTVINACADDDSVDSATEYSVVINEIYDEIVVAHRQGDNCHLIISHTLGPSLNQQPPQPSAAIIFPESFYSQNPSFVAELWPPSYSSTPDRLFSPSLEEGVMTHDTLQMLTHENLIQMATGAGQQSGFAIALPMGPIEIERQNQLYVIDPILQDPIVTTCGSTASSSSIENEPAPGEQGASDRSTNKETSRSKRKRKAPSANILAETSPRPPPEEGPSNAAAASESYATNEQDHYQFRLTGHINLGIEVPHTSRAKKNRKRKNTVSVPVTMLVSTNTTEGTVNIDSLSSRNSKFTINISRKLSQASSPVKAVPDKSLREVWEIIERRAIQRIMGEVEGPQIYGVRQIINSSPPSDAKTIPLTPKINLQVIDESDSKGSLVDIFIESRP
ncbi:hypothetical protein [Endozoicomonas sp. 8E]|uniref:hypothetical protein n=1 Tax=Endozoicomonas sp. 8E TaxID=3035692 RepID=UPI002938F93A|nr:hypothetical protein [Endozoicomonas sp. 8E]WOG25957.1 hypothetical protein P6910_15405 [Endozoicomonas sp. 8E]